VLVAKMSFFLRNDAFFYIPAKGGMQLNNETCGSSYNQYSRWIQVAKDWLGKY